MITIKGVSTLEGSIIDLSLPSEEERTIMAGGLILLPGLIDSHVHFRTPGLEYKGNWESEAKAAIHGGITTVFDMPNTIPPTVTLERLEEKKGLISAQLKKVGIPLHYGLYLGADKTHFDEIARCRGKIVGIKVFMGSSTGGLVMDDDSSLHAIFSLAASHNLLLAVHAEDEALIHERTAHFRGQMEAKVHSEIRNGEVAFRATQKAIELAKLYKTRLHILHVGTAREIEIIKQAKKEGFAISVETTPHHLFLTVDDYEKLGTKVQMNPPLRTKEDADALWQAIAGGVIDTIGSDHAPHTREEKALPYGQAPSGIPGVETTLPLLLDGCHRGRITLKQIVRLMRERVLEIFSIPPNDDYILIDMKKKVTIDEHSLKTKCGWSPYAGREIQGWPVYTILRGKVYEL
ncbi:MAG: dihydroorotase [Rhabdochlamydiaceae bacterium]